MQNNQKDTQGQKSGNKSNPKAPDTLKKKPASDAKKLKHDPYDNIPEFGDDELELLQDERTGPGSQRKNKQKEIFSDEDLDEGYYI